MEDKELFNFFRTRSASFDEMPSDELWNKIQNAIEIPKKTSSATISKIVLLTTLSLATVTAIVFFINKNKNPIMHDHPIHPNKIEARPSTDSLEVNNLERSTTSFDSIQLTDDTLKKKKIDVKKPILNLKKDILLMESVTPLPLKKDSIQIINPKIFEDTLKIKPLKKGNRLLFETKKTLSKSEFDAFIQKILKQTEKDFGNLLIIKAKGHKPFRHIIRPTCEEDTVKTQTF